MVTKKIFIPYPLQHALIPYAAEIVSVVFRVHFPLIELEVHFPIFFLPLSWLLSIVVLKEFLSKWLLLAIWYVSLNLVDWFGGRLLLFSTIEDQYYHGLEPLLIAGFRPPNPELIFRLNSC